MENNPNYIKKAAKEKGPYLTSPQRKALGFLLESKTRYIVMEILKTIQLNSQLDIICILLPALHTELNKKGESISTISRRLGITMEAIDKTIHDLKKNEALWSCLSVISPQNNTQRKIHLGKSEQKMLTMLRMKDVRDLTKDLLLVAKFEEATLVQYMRFLLSHDKSIETRKKVNPGDIDLKLGITKRTREQIMYRLKDSGLWYCLPPYIKNKRIKK